MVFSLMVLVISGLKERVHAVVDVISYAPASNNCTGTSLFHHSN